MMRRCLPALMIVLFSPLVAAENTIDLNVNNDAARIMAAFELSNNILVDGSWFHNSDRGDVVGAGFHVTGDATGGRNPLKAGLGVRLLQVDPDIGSDDGTVLPIGGFVNYTLPEYDRFVVGGSLYYAPDVLSFGDATKYWEYNAWAGYSVLRNGLVYAGLRGIRADFENTSSITLDTGLHVGLRLEF